jgi:hypothetical protein
MPVVPTPGAGRPPAPETPASKRATTRRTRDRRVQVRCTSVDETMWRKAAAAAGMELSEWIRRRLATAVEAGDYAAPEIDLADMQAVRRKINGVSHTLEILQGDRARALIDELADAQRQLSGTIERSLGRPR